MQVSVACTIVAKGVRDPVKQSYSIHHTKKIQKKKGTLHNYLTTSTHLNLIVMSL